MEAVHCDLCGQKDARFEAKQTDFMHQSTTEVFSVVSCTTCDLHYTNPRPTESEIGQYYVGSYSFHNAPSQLKRYIDELLYFFANHLFFVYLFNWIPFVREKLILRIRPTIADPIREFLKKNPNASFMDIGCGAGEHAHFWGHRGSVTGYRRMGVKNVYAMEIAEKARESLREKGVTPFKSLVDVPADLKLDVIRMNWSLEHVHRPSEYFQFVRQHLKPGGLCLLTIPNNDGILYRMYPDCLELPIHLYHFSPDTIHKYAQKHGLVVQKTETFSYPGSFYFNGQVYPSRRDSENASGPQGFARMSLVEAYYFNRVLQRAGNHLGNDLIVLLTV